MGEEWLNTRTFLTDKGEKANEIRMWESPFRGELQTEETLSPLSGLETCRTAGRTFREHARHHQSSCVVVPTNVSTEGGWGQREMSGSAPRHTTLHWVQPPSAPRGAPRRHIREAQRSAPSLQH